jgi:hypothetical protein
MSNNIIFLLMYHCHKLLDLINKSSPGHVAKINKKVTTCAGRRTVLVRLLSFKKGTIGTKFFFNIINVALLYYV